MPPDFIIISLWSIPRIITGIPSEIYLQTLPETSVSIDSEILPMNPPNGVLSDFFLRILPKISPRFFTRSPPKIPRTFPGIFRNICAGIFKNSTDLPKILSRTPSSVP